MSMLRDDAYINAKGHVKLELYNEQGEVTFTKEKKNLVVLSANEIVGTAFSDPKKKVRANQTDAGASDLVAGADGSYAFNLSLQPQIDGSYSVDVGSTNANQELVMTNVANIITLKKVTVDGVDLVIDKDVFLKDADQGLLHFAVAPKNRVSIEFRRVNNAYVELVAGTETVTVGGVAFTRGTAPSDADKTYTIDYGTGKVFFETAKAAVSVAYVFKVRFSLGFMGLGGKPAGHPDYKPVEFSSLDKMKILMDAEFEGCRQLIRYPAPIGTGEPELEVFPTQPMAKASLTNTIVGAATDTYALPGAAGKPLTDLVSARDITDPANPVDVTLNVTIKDANTATIQFNPAPAVGNNYEIAYKVRDNVDYTHYTLSQGPVLELVSVTHEDLNNKVTEYLITNSGLVNGDGDVWLINPSQGIVGFSTSPKGKDAQNPAPGVETPGQLTFQYRINSGTTVQFVADFPKGIPGPLLTQNDEVLPMNTGQTTYSLQHPVAKDGAGALQVLSIKKGATDLVAGTDYDLSADGTQLILKVAVATGDTVSISYKWYKDTHDIYQVAMFTEQTLGKMFNISGIGPVTKDKNTGMRITWSVTF
ncbi:hypothetical protein SAMN02799624_05216 [Paenibacillus sp. UNC496MF]|uniref:hypothetical protein n=1 Tax=Paenibacillus sp. UNC496MF TaxID=1502753 RepID=UPI0008E9C5AB|nr:hypothetical protein [Paenibacillus sp. UNC496MF]SFJ62250.1 hypothetical protein SAMN02799624_05216 [Paenibacillus sp. UNC496MF]